MHDRINYGKKGVPVRFFRLNDGDLAAFLGKWAEDSVFIYPILSAGGEIKGRKAIEEWFQPTMD